MRKLTHQLQAKALEFVLLNQLVQIDREQLESDACVISERKRVEHVYDVHRVVLILFAKMLQDADLFLRLAMETLLVAHHLQGDIFALFVVIRLHHLPETTLAYHFEHFISVGYVIVRYVDVRTLFVVVLTIVRESDKTWSLFGVRAYEIHLRIIEYLAVFVGGQFIHVELHDLLRAGSSGRRTLVRRLRGGWRRSGRAWLQRRQRPVPEQRAPERVRAPQRHVAGHGRAAATSAHFARRGNDADPRSLARTTATAPHCTCTRRRSHSDSGTLHDISHQPRGAITTLPLMRAHSVSAKMR